MYCAVIDKKKVYLPQEIMEEHFKTNRLFLTTE